MEQFSKQISLVNRSMFEPGGEQSLQLPSIKNSKIGNGTSPIRASILNIKRREAIEEQKQAAPQSATVGTRKVEIATTAMSKMNPKVLETWINETLQDAEHLDIPGVILKP